MRRAIVRKNEWVHLTPLPFSVVVSVVENCPRVSMFATLMGIEAAPPSRRVEVEPTRILHS